MNKIEIAKKELHLDKLKLARKELDFKVLEREEDIARIQKQIDELNENMLAVQEELKGVKDVRL